MRRLGEVVGDTEGVTVVRCEEGFDPEFDEAVYDEALDRVGETVEFFGPVDRPYALVGDGERSVDEGDVVYLN